MAKQDNLTVRCDLNLNIARAVVARNLWKTKVLKLLVSTA
jgi:hypothetical protein